MSRDERALLARLVEAQLALARCEADPAAVFRLLVRFACDLVGADGASIEQVDGPEMVCVTAHGTLDESVGLRLARHGSMSGLAVASGQMQMAENTTTDQRVDAAACTRLGIGSMAVLPMRDGKVTMGVLKVAMVEHDAVTSDLVRPLIPLVETAIARLGQLRAAEEAGAQTRLLLAVTSASRSILAAEDPAQALCTAMREIIGAEWVGYFEPNGETALTMRTQAGKTMPAFGVSLDSPSLAGSAYVTRRARLVNDFRADPETAAGATRWLDAAGLTGVHAAAFLPVGHDDHCLGVVAAVLAKSLNTKDMNLLGILDSLAGEAAIAIERHQLRAQLAAQARTDSLTGIANRRAWDEHFSVELGRATRHGHPLSVVMLDLDHFKAYNDAFGHPAGDDLLRAVTAVWAGMLRASDLLARLGGEEFGLLLPETDIDNARILSRRLLDAVPLGQTASAGVATAAAGECPDELLGRADRALYQAKEDGRDRVVCAQWRPTLHPPPLLESTTEVEAR